MIGLISSLLQEARFFVTEMNKSLNIAGGTSRISEIIKRDFDDEKRNWDKSEAVCNDR